MFDIAEESKMLKAIQAAYAVKRKCDDSGSDWTCFPGLAAFREDSDLLRHTSAGVDVIVVTGTNGKTTTAGMISQMLSARGTKNACNRFGSNIENGLATALVLNRNENGAAKAKYAVLECDEKYSTVFMPQVSPKVLVITNIFDDQISRLHGEEKTAQAILSAMSAIPPAICCMDAKCHFIDRFTKIPGWNYCFFDADDEAAIVDGKRYPLSLAIPGRYNIRNAAAAIAVVKSLGLLNEACLNALSEIKPVFGRMEHIQKNGTDIRIMLAKNNAGWNVTMEYLTGLKKPPIPHLYLAINDFPGDDRDRTWIFTNDYSPLLTCFDRIHISGSCGKMIKDEIFDSLPDSDDRIDVVDIEDIIPTIIKEQQHCCIIGNYSAMMALRIELFKSGLADAPWNEISGQATR